VGTSVSGFTVTGVRAPDDRTARDDRGHDVLLVVGDPERDADLAAERAALERLAGDTRFPSLHAEARGEDGRSLLVLSRPVGNPLAACAASLDLATTLRLVREALGLADRLERAGLALHPQPDDLHVDDEGALSLARLRGSVRLRTNERLDPQPLLEAMGRSLLPDPAASGPPRLVRLLILGGGMQTIEDARDELERIEGELATATEDEPRVAAVTDRGRRHEQNEDACAVALGDDWTVLVVCDGISSSTHPERASATACQTACEVLVEYASSSRREASQASAMIEAVHAAHEAIASRVIAAVDEEPPGTTLVAALVRGRRATIGWVGDSRAYWITSRGGRLLTHDHSWVNEVIEHGGLTEAEALASPLAHALTSCLGPRAPGDTTTQAEPSIVTRALEEPGRLVLCTDGLWNYLSSADELAQVIARAPAPVTCASVARWLVNHALMRGGHDNVTVAVLELAANR
jgi:serine/threonine protein phosphatase PrpC